MDFSMFDDLRSCIVVFEGFGIHFHSQITKIRGHNCVTILMGVLMSLSYDIL